MKAYEETYGFLRQFIETESHGAQSEPEAESPGDKEAKGSGSKDQVVQQRDPPPPPPPARTGVQMMAGERVVFSEEGEASQYLKLVASGDIDAGMLEALEDFVKRQKRRLARIAPTEPSPTE